MANTFNSSTNNFILKKHSLKRNLPTAAGSHFRVLPAVRIHAVHPPANSAATVEEVGIFGEKKPPPNFAPNFAYGISPIRSRDFAAGLRISESPDVLPARNGETPPVVALPEFYWGGSLGN